MGAAQCVYYTYLHVLFKQRFLAGEGWGVRNAEWVVAGVPAVADLAESGVPRRTRERETKRLAMVAVVLGLVAWLIR